MRLEPFKLKTFSLTVALNVVIAAALLYVLRKNPQHQEYFYGPIAVMFAIATTWAIVAWYRKRRREG